MEPKGVDKEYKILDDVAKYGNYKERFSPIGVREGAGKQSENNRRKALEQSIVGLLNSILLLCECIAGCWPVEGYVKAMNTTLQAKHIQMF